MDEGLAQSRIVSRGAFFVIAVLILSILAFNTPRLAAAGTWVIEDETVVIADQMRVQEGNIIIRGTGQLVLQNTTLQLQQLGAYQYDICVEDSAQLLINRSQIQSKYPFTIFLFASSNLTILDSMARRVKLIVKQNAAVHLSNATFLELQTYDFTSLNLVQCHFGNLVTRDSGVANIWNCTLSTLRYEDYATVMVSDSSIGLAVCEGVQLGNFTFSVIESVHGWFSSQLFIENCVIEDYYYADYSKASIKASYIGFIDASGLLPLTLEQITIGSAVLKHTSNVTMLNCTAEDIGVYNHANVRIVESSCTNFRASQNARAIIQGSEENPCTFTDCVITQYSRANISWAIFDYLELSHSTQAQVNDSNINRFYNWVYTSCSYDIYRCNFTTYGQSANCQTIMTACNIAYWCNIGSGSIFNATSCRFETELNLYGNCEIYLKDCTAYRVRPRTDCQVFAKNCSLEVEVSNSDVHSLREGYVTYWNSLNSGSLPTVIWNLTAIDTTFLGWNIVFASTEIFVVSNSSLNKIGIGTNVCPTSTALIYNSSVMLLDLAYHSNITTFNSQIDELRQRDFSFCMLNNCTIRRGNCYYDAISKFIDSNFTQELNLNNIAEFNNCTLSFLRCLGTSNTTFRFSTITFRLECWDSPTVWCYNTTFTGSLNAMESPTVYLYNSTLMGLAGYGNAILHSENCNITSLYMREQSQFFGTHTTINYFYNRGTSSTVFSGNLTHTDSWYIGDNSQVIRELIILVLDHNGLPVDNALVRFLSPSETLLDQGMTSSDGRCTFNILFINANSSFFDDNFSCVASYGAYNNTISCLMASSLPLVVILDLSNPPNPALPENTGDEEACTSDDATELITKFEVIWKLNVEFGKIMGAFIIVWLLFLSNHFVVRTVFPHSLSDIPSIYKIIHLNWGRE